MRARGAVGDTSGADRNIKRNRKCLKCKGANFGNLAGCALEVLSWVRNVVKEKVLQRLSGIIVLGVLEQKRDF